MALPAFKSFMPTVAIWRSITSLGESRLKLLFDNVSGSPVGIQSQADNSPNGIWAPVPLSLAQIEAPTAEMLDLNATYQLNAAPYSRYRSDGTQLVPMDGESGTVIPPGINVVYFSPLVITEGNPLTIEGGVRVIA